MVDPLFWIVLVSTALSCFFSLTGSALRIVRRVQLEDFFQGSKGQAAMASYERHLSSLRLMTAWGWALANLALLASLLFLLGGPVGWTTMATAVGVALAIITIFGVAIPYAWASHAGEKVLCATLPILFVLRVILYPILAIMQVFDVPIRRLSGVSDQEQENGEHAKEEILHVAAEGRAEGAVDAEEVEMIASVIEFGDTCSGEIMTPRTDVFALQANMDRVTVAEKIVKAGHSRVPVYEGDLDNIIGILYAKDLLQPYQADVPLELRKLMRKPYFVPETKRLDDLLREFKTRKVHIAVILDEYGGTAGIVTIEDLLEEIVGEIADEYDHSPPALMQRIDERAAEIDGRLRIDDLNETMGLDVPEEEDYDTAAGFVFSELGCIPTVGEKVESCGAVFTVLEADDRKITRLRVDVLPDSGEDDDAE